MLNTITASNGVLFDRYGSKYFALVIENRGGMVAVKDRRIFSRFDFETTAGADFNFTIISAGKQYVEKKRMMPANRILNW
jgi:hypothetical protein